MQSRSYEKKVILSHLGGIEFWAHVSTRRLHDVIRKKKAHELWRLAIGHGLFLWGGETV